MQGITRVDEYDFRARYVPAIIVTLPALAAVFALFPAARSLYGLIIGPTIEAVLVLLLVCIARDEGKKMEALLIREWDGMPTTRFLRHRNEEIERLTRERYKASLMQLAGVTFPSPEEEARDPRGADAIYASAITALRERRRGKTYRLVFHENCNYGMMRNLLGLRTLGIWLAAGSALVASLGFLLPSTSRDATIFTLLVSVLIIAILLRFVTKGAVKRIAEAYATALLRTCEPARARTRR